ncbi:DEAD/DEAH box helicase family protein [Streptomyces flavofungini]|uniref:DEAD/DEAH box helicase family protein n=1 Tax=Streptomyces flavofungini TaxID=68200 RepID=UPI00339D82A9
MDADVRSEAELSAFYAHQDDAVTAIMRIYTPSPRARRPRFRAQLHMAPGLGKTRVAARVADLVAGQGSLLTVVPTRTLLEQTHHVLRAAGRSGPVIAVYSPRGAALAGEPGGGCRRIHGWWCGTRTPVPPRAAGSRCWRRTRAWRTR